MAWSQFLQLLKEFGPVVGALLLIVFFQTRRIDHLLDRNEKIYEEHIKNLWETQKQLLTRLLGPQESSQDFPTVDDLKKKALSQGKESSKETGDKK
jgi:hypothetical protein